MAASSMCWAVTCGDAFIPASQAEASAKLTIRRNIPSECSANRSTASAVKRSEGCSFKAKRAAKK
jgi:hypothetical protein